MPSNVVLVLFFVLTNANVFNKLSKCIMFYFMFRLGRWLVARDLNTHTHKYDQSIDFSFFLSFFSHLSCLPNVNNIKRLKLTSRSNGQISNGNTRVKSISIFNSNKAPTTMHARETIFENSQFINLSKFFKYRPKIMFF